MATGRVNSRGGFVTTRNLAKYTPGTATAADILEGEIAWVNGEQVIGTIPVHTAQDELELIELTVGEEYTLPTGYYEEGSIVITNEKVQFVNGSARAGDVLSTKTIMVDGKAVRGTIPIRTVADIKKVN